MKNMKTVTTFFLLLAILIAAYIGSTYLASKAREREAINRNVPELYGSFTVENNQFGYKFTVSEQYFQGYQEDSYGYTSTYIVPKSTDGLTTDWEYHRVFRITAIPIDYANSIKAKCDANQADSPLQCIDYKNPPPKNNLFYFDIRPVQLGITDFPAEKERQILEAVRNSIEYFDVATKPTELSFKSRKQGYEIKYPAEFDTSFLEAGVINLPFNYVEPGAIEGTENLTALPNLQNVIPVRYCALSGVCTQTTTNFQIGVARLFMTEEALLKAPLEPEIVKTNVEGYTLYTYELGAEGEGIIYTFMIAPESTIMVFAHRYINENVISVYKNAKGFVPFEQQKRIIRKMIINADFQYMLNLVD